MSRFYYNKITIRPVNDNNCLSDSLWKSWTWLGAIQSQTVFDIGPTLVALLTLAHCQHAFSSFWIIHMQKSQDEMSFLLRSSL